MIAEYMELGLFVIAGLIVLYLLFRVFFKGKHSYKHKEQALRDAHKEEAIPKHLYNKKMKELQKEQQEAAHKEEKEKVFHRKKAALEEAVRKGSLTRQDYIKQMYILDRERKKKH